MKILVPPMVFSRALLLYVRLFVARTQITLQLMQFVESKIADHGRK
jgi:hypothetical protein